MAAPSCEPSPRRARIAPPSRCLDDTCRGRLERSGSAIQRLEEDLRSAFPRARLLRLDSDTMRRRDDYEAALRSFEAGAADIIHKDDVDSVNLSEALIRAYAPRGH